MATREAFLVQADPFLKAQDREDAVTRDSKANVAPEPIGNERVPSPEPPSNLRDMDWFSNTFLEMLIRSLPGVFYLFDPSLKFLRWNQNFEKVTGYSREEFRTVSVNDLFSGESWQRIQSAIRHIFETGEGCTEAYLETRDGRSIPYFWTGISATIEGTPFIVGMGTDLSQLKETEDALRDSEVLYRMLAERIPIGAMLYQNGRIIFANDAFVSMFGFRDKYQLLDKDIDHLFSKGYETYFRQTFEGVEKGMSRDRPIDTCCLTWDGREVWLEGQASLIRWKHQPTVFITVRDTTQDRHREMSMQEEKEHLRRENVSLRSSLRDRYRLGNIVGKSPAMQEVYELISNAAATSASVFISGESGTGKELVARAVHEMSNRSGKAFVPVNCAAIPESLIESEFFGHKRGSFTGAHTDMKGYLDMANGGTLFLDELGDLNLTLQAKLLRAIEGGGYTPVGDNQVRYSDFRVIAATNRNVWRDVKRGIIREDFFYRLHVIPIKLPPLRHRKEDIPLLLEYFLKLQTSEGKMPRIPGHVIEALMSYDWPGNVRELQNAIQRYLVVGRMEFIPTDSSEEVEPEETPAIMTHDPGETALGLSENIQDAERAVIRKALDQNHGNKTLAAKALGVSRRTLSRKLKRLALS